MFLQVAETLVAQIISVADDEGPVLCTGHRVERVGVIADGIQTTNDTTHRGSCDDVDRDAGFLQNLQHTDMCHTFRTTAAQYDSHFLTLTFRVGRLSDHHATHQQRSEENQ